MTICASIPCYDSYQVNHVRVVHVPRQSKVKKQLPYTATPGDGKPFESVVEFKEWFEKNRQVLYGYAVKKVNRRAKLSEEVEAWELGIDAEDILHKTALEVLADDRWTQYDPLKGATARTWFTVRLNSRIIDAFRKFDSDKARMGSPSEVETPEHYDDLENGLRSDKGAAAEHIVNEVETCEQAEYLHKAFIVLTDQERQVLDLFYWEDLSEKDIARKMGTTPSVVAHRKQDAFGKLRDNPALVAMWTETFGKKRKY